VYFSPEKNNVLFASAVDCWCFDVFTFSKILAEKINANPKVLFGVEKVKDLETSKIYVGRLLL
jgi:hypothetical protein